MILCSESFVISLVALSESLLGPTHEDDLGRAALLGRDAAFTLLSFFAVTKKLCDAWTWWIVGLFGCPASCCMSCVRAPWTWGLFMCFCALFSPLNVEGVYNEHSLCCNCNSLTSNLPSALCLLGEGLRSPPPCIIMIRYVTDSPSVLTAQCSA